MTAYAEGTAVIPERSQAEIMTTLRRYGAASFAYGEQDGQAVLGFTAHGRSVRFVLPLPTDRNAFSRTPTGRVRDPKAAQAALEAEHRRRWRALALAIKAKLEVVESGIATFEEEFLAHVVLPGGSTVGGRVLPGTMGHEHPAGPVRVRRAALPQASPHRRRAAGVVAGALGLSLLPLTGAHAAAPDITCDIARTHGHLPKVRAFDSPQHKHLLTVNLDLSYKPRSEMGELFGTALLQRWTGRRWVQQGSPDSAEGADRIVLRPVSVCQPGGHRYRWCLDADAYGRRPEAVPAHVRDFHGPTSILGCS